MQCLEEDSDVLSFLALTILSLSVSAIFVS
jgi:hypothetical protein